MVRLLSISALLLLKSSYRTPINGQQLKLEKVQSLAFSEKLDAVIKNYLEYCSRVKKACEFDAAPSLEKQFLFDRHHGELKKLLRTLQRRQMPFLIIRVS